MDSKVRFITYEDIFSQSNIKVTLKGTFLYEDNEYYIDERTNQVIPVINVGGKRESYIEYEGNEPKRVKI